MLRQPLRRLLVFPLLLGAIVQSGGPVSAGRQAPQTPPPQETQPTFRTKANFVRVDVYPTADGQPVLDLGKADFQLLEDGTPQTVDTFELVRVRPAGPQTARSEPNTVAESREMAADPRSRVFVIFLDTYHVGVEGSHRMRQSLVRLMDRVIGQDNLVGVMTPYMSAGDLTLARRTETIEGLLSSAWDWGQRNTFRRDPEELRYEECYPDPDTRSCTHSQGMSSDGVAREMIARRRERRTLDAIQDLVRHLNGLREERKAILTISDGWSLFTENARLAAPIKCAPLPGTPQIGVSGQGTLTTGNDKSEAGATQYGCDSDRLMLAQLDNQRHFDEILQEANRANATFYTIDPRGMPVFDTPIGPGPMVGLKQDREQLMGRQQTLRTMAEQTDGLAVVNRNDIDPALKRIADDLSSYYLLGYYSTNTALDGKFRKITVKVVRPGVTVRARRGYRAATREEVESTLAAPAPASPDAVRVGGALERLRGIRPQSRFRLDATALSSAGVWVVGEIDYEATRSGAWAAGGTATVSAKGPDGTAIGTTTIEIAPGARTFTTLIRPDSALPVGEYVVQTTVRAHNSEGLPFQDSVRVRVRDAVAHGAVVLGDPLRFRRGPATGLRFHPTADARFMRSERVRVEVPVVGTATAVTMRLLDARGQPLPLLVKSVPASQAGLDGVTWTAGELTLAPLASGDYLIELTAEHAGGREVVVSGFRVIP